MSELKRYDPDGFPSKDGTNMDAHEVIEYIGGLQGELEGALRGEKELSAERLKIEKYLDEIVFSGDGDRAYSLLERMRHAVESAKRDTADLATLTARLEQTQLERDTFRVVLGSAPYWNQDVGTLYGKYGEWYCTTRKAALASVAPQESQQWHI